MGNIDEIIAAIEAVQKRMVNIQDIPLESEEVKKLARAVDNLIDHAEVIIKDAIEQLIKGEDDEEGVQNFIEKNNFEFNGCFISYDRNGWYSDTPVFWASSSTYC